MIRPYQNQDIDQLLDVWYAASSLAHPFLSDEFMAQERINIREVYTPNTITSVYEQAGAVVGFVAMMGNEVGAIFVEPKFHGQGIGRALMDHVAAQYEVLELDVFEANSIGRRFYERYGFHEVKRHIFEPTGDALVRLSCAGLAQPTDPCLLNAVFQSH